METPKGLEMTLCAERRLCWVPNSMYPEGKRYGYFHCWEHYATVIEESPLTGSIPAGQISEVFGIVEFADGVERVDPLNIHFEDDESQYLKTLEQMRASGFHAGYRTKVTIADEMEGEKK